MIGTVAVIAAFFIYYSRHLPTIAQVKEGVVVVPESTKIYDRSGKHLLYTIHGEENRTKITLDQIPSYVKWATIATEDQGFYTRELAVDFKGIARAVMAVMRYKCFTCGQGGSTITQQLVKNLILTREKTIGRKIKEIILSFRIEKTFSRDEILELYLNQIPYGSNAYGIEQAAETFFAKSAKNLTLGESALLAALPKATTYYSPFGSHTDELFRRQKIILKQMLEEGYITEEQWKQALEEKVEFSSSLTNIKAPHFVIYVREILAGKYGEAELEKGGFQVITTLDYDMQQRAERIVAEGAKSNEALGAGNAALVALDPKTGAILAIVGSRDYFDKKRDGNFNAVLAVRNPGSSFKPVVYAAAFTKGYTPNTILYDVETDFVPGENKEYRPRNFDGLEHGPVTIRRALGGSLNIPAVKALYLTGVNQVLDYALQLGYTTLKDPSSVGLSLALGGGGVKLIEHVGSFATFANDGVRQEVTALLKVTKPDGAVLYEFKESLGVRVFPQNVARMITDILSDNDARSFIFGSASALSLGSVPAAVKTGTTNEFRDGWAIGYTPTLAAGVWVGNNDNSPMGQNADGSKVAAPIWNRFMKESLAGRAIVPFLKPEIPKTGKPILDGDIGGIRKVAIDKITGKLATEYTPKDMVEEKTFAEFHSILHYVDKDNPLGPEPADPSLDPQYKNWEKGVFAWVEKSQAEAQFKSPPAERDDVHVPANIPTVNVISPFDGAEIKEDSLLVEVEANAARGITKVEYYVDGVFRESAGLKPYSRRLYFGRLTDGEHTITVQAHDDVGNRKEAAVVIRLHRGLTEGAGVLPEEARPRVQFISPHPDDVLLVSNFPIALEMDIINGILVQFVSLYYNDARGNPMLIAQSGGMIDNRIKMFWNNPPQAGAYVIYAIVVDKSGNSYREEVKITVK